LALDKIKRVIFYEAKAAINGRCLIGIDVFFVGLRRIYEVFET